MKNVHQLKLILGAILAIPVILLWCPHQSRAASQPITPEALRYSGPFEITSRIMEIDSEKQLLVVAEKEIHVVDLIVGGEHFLTLLSDAEGDPLRRPELHAEGTFLHVRLSGRRQVVRLLLASPDAG